MATAHQSSNALRRRELAQIHMAKAALSLDEGTYRDMLFAVARVRSAADLDYSGRRRVLEHLKSRGWKPGRARRSKYADDPLSGKIMALWLELRDQGVIENPSDQALAKFCRDVGGADRPEWLNNKQAHQVIEGLKAWLKRGTTQTAIE